MARKTVLEMKQADAEIGGALPEWLTIEDVARELRCSPSHVCTLLGQRGGPVLLPYFKHRHRTLILRKELERYQQQVSGSTAVMRTPQMRKRAA